MKEVWKEFSLGASPSDFIWNPATCPTLKHKGDGGKMKAKDILLIFVSAVLIISSIVSVSIIYKIKVNRDEHEDILSRLRETINKYEHLKSDNFNTLNELRYTKIELSYFQNVFIKIEAENTWEEIKGTRPDEAWAIVCGKLDRLLLSKGE